MTTKDLNAEQLESIRRLLIDPLRDAVKAEVELGHGRLRQAVEQLAAQVAAHAEANHQRATETTRRLVMVEAEVTKFGPFRNRVLVVYGFLAAGLSLIWSIVRDRVVSKFTSRGP